MQREDNIIGNEPARTIYKRGLQKKVNRQACRKTEGIVDTESLGESIILVAAEVDPRVRRLVPQPVTFDLNTGEAYPTKAELIEAVQGTRYKPWVYTPDFLLQLVNGRNVFVEGKHSLWLREDPRFSLVREAMAELGHRLTVVTEATFSPALHRNLRILRAITDRQLQPDRRAWIEGHLPDEFSFGQAQWMFGMTRSEVYAALFDGLLATDLSITPFGDRTRLVRVQSDESHLQVLPL